MIRLLIILLAVSSAAIFYLLFSGPRMLVQPHVKTYQAIMPTPPPGLVAVDTPTPLPTTQQAARLVNPLEPSAENIERGRVYYGYYCLQCHAADGNGYGPVGQSYVPTPADLRTEKVQSYSDGELLRASLTGMGHSPVLEGVVLPEHRWYLVLYTRHLGGR